MKIGSALHRIIRDMSSEAYHGTTGTWSSSQLKDILEDEEVFIQKYIKMENPRLSNDAFDTGTYFHTGLLEPHKLAKEVAVFEGAIRSGKAWIDFKNKNKDKMIVSIKQKDQAEGMIKAVKASPVSQMYLKGDPELSLFVELVVSKGRIHAPYYQKVLTLTGWKDFVGKVGKGFSLVVKVRADCLGDTFISDLKSTSGKATQLSSVRNTISKYKYDLSAALYLDIFSLEKPDVSAFIWIFCSKENPCAASWLAAENQILVGRAKWSKAVIKMADLASANWQIPDRLRDVEPLPFELEWLSEKDTDLL